MKITRRNIIQSLFFSTTLGPFVKNVSSSAQATSETAEESWTQFAFDTANTGNGSENSPAIATETEPGDGVGFDFGMDFETEAFGGVGTPVIKQDTAYAISGSELAAFDINSGSREWSYQTEVNSYSTSPTLVDDNIYIHDQNAIISINTTDGTERWRYETADFGPSRDYSPIVSDGILYSTDATSLYALDIENGDEVWTEDYGSERAGIAVYDNAAYLIEDTIEEERAVSISLDNRNELWSVPLEGMLAYSSPTVAEDVVLFPLRGRFGEEGNGLYAFDANTGEQLWNTTNNINDERPVSSPAINNGIVIIWSSEEGLIALDLADGSRVWTVEGASGFSSSGSPAPVTVGDTVYVNDWGSNLSAYNISDGSELWSLPLPQPSSSSDISSPIVVDGELYIAATGSRLFGVDREETFAVYPNRLYLINDVGRTLPEVRVDYSPSPPVTGEPTEFSARVIDDQDDDEWEFTWGIVDGDESFEYTGQTVTHEFTTADEGSARVGITNDENLGNAGRTSFDVKEGTNDGVAGVLFRQTSEATDNLAVLAGGGAATAGVGYLAYRSLRNDDEAKPSDESTIESDKDEPITQSSGSSSTSLLSVNQYDTLAIGDTVERHQNIEIRQATTKNSAVWVLTPVYDEETIDSAQFEDFQDRVDPWVNIDNHDNLISVYGHSSEPTPWIAVEPADYPSLNDRTLEFTTKKIVKYITHACEAVHHIHRYGIAYKNLSIESVLIDNDTVTLRGVLDHASTDEDGYALPTSDEDPEDERADVYRLGALAYEVLTSSKPAHPKPMPPSDHNSSLSAGLDEILLKALANNPDDRYETVLHFRDKLEDHFGQL